MWVDRERAKNCVYQLRPMVDKTVVVGCKASREVVKNKTGFWPVSMTCGTGSLIWRVDKGCKVFWCQDLVDNYLYIYHIGPIRVALGFTYFYHLYSTRTAAHLRRSKTPRFTFLYTSELESLYTDVTEGMEWIWESPICPYVRVRIFFLHEIHQFI